jgi:hypothetical protein
MSHSGRLEASGTCLTFISVAATAPPCPALPTRPLGGMCERSRHDVTCIDMRATHAILLWKPDGRNADDLISGPNKCVPTRRSVWLSGCLAPTVKNLITNGHLPE